jgi:hypothetical protein
VLAVDVGLCAALAVGIAEPAEREQLVRTEQAQLAVRLVGDRLALFGADEQRVGHLEILEAVACRELNDGLHR